MLHFAHMAGISIDELESFSFPGEHLNEEHRLLRILAKNGKQYECALVVGRFQPLHRGHIYLLRCALTIAKDVIICIGSADSRDAENPFSLQTREALLQRALKREAIAQHVMRIFTLNDTPDDDEWLAQAIQKAGSFDVVIGNNNWVNDLFKQAGYPILEIPLLKREVFEGKAIRQNLRRTKQL